MSQLSLRFPKHLALLSPDEMYEMIDEAIAHCMTCEGLRLS